MFDNARIVRKYYQIAKPPKRDIALLFATHLLGNVPYMFTPLIYGFIIRYIGELNFEMTLAMMGVYFSLKVCSKFAYWANYSVMKNYYHALYASLQRRLMRKVEYADVGWFSSGIKSHLLNVANVDLRELASFSNWLNDFFVYAISFIVAVAVQWNISPLLTVFGVFINALVIAMLNRYNARYADIVTEAKQKTDEETAFFSQIISGIHEIKAFNIIGKLSARYGAINEAFLRSNDERIANMRTKDILVPSITMMAELTIMSFLVYRAFHTGLGVDMIVVVIAYSGAMFGDLRSIIASLSSLREVSVSIDRYGAIINADTGGAVSGTGEQDAPDGRITMQNVCFGYSGAEVLRDFSVEIQPRRITALVGPSGSGKSTVFNLLTRFYRPQSGSIAIDGIDIREFSTEAYSRNVSIIRQDSFLFHMTIYDNLALINPDREAIKEVCKKVHLDGFIQSLPDGYDTMLSEDATDLSGGQKQRLAIARALLKGSKILLCDELTSALDEQLAESIFDLLQDIKQDHTIVLITHKKAERDRADAIIDLTSQNDGVAA